MKLVITYFDRYTNKPVRQEVSAGMDVIGIEIPAQPGENLPRLKVDVNTDAVIVTAEDAAGEMKKVSQYDFNDILEDADGDGYTRPLSRDANEKIAKLDRRQIEDALTAVSIQCNDSESTEELREALRANVLDGTISPDDLPEV